MVKQVLNKVLYRRLEATFGEVEIMSQGERQVRVIRRDISKKRSVVSIKHFGETYKVCCPLCGDTKFRLLFSHRYGTLDENNFEQFRLVKCFNEGCPLCNKTEKAYKAIQDLVTGRKLYQISKAKVAEGKDVDLNQYCKSWPGKMLNLGELPEDHAAIVYLKSRGYDPDYLEKVFGVRWCEKSEYRPAQGRIIIPIYQDQKLVGWQSRFPSDTEWKKTGLPKYFTAKGTPKASILYNLDLARKFKVGILCEGVTDAWRIGQYGMAYLGESPSYRQRHLVAKMFADYSVVLVPDDEVLNHMKTQEKTKEKWNEIRTFLKSRLSGGCAIISIGVKDLSKLKNQKHAKQVIEEQAEKARVKIDWGMR